MGALVPLVSPVPNWARILFVVLICPAVLRAEAGPQNPASERLRHAIDALNAAPNYSWTQTTKNAPLKEEPVLTGQTERGGYTVTVLRATDLVARHVSKGDEDAGELSDGHWQTTREYQAALSKRLGREVPRTPRALRPEEDLQRLFPHLADIAVNGNFITATIDAEGVAQRYRLDGPMHGVLRIDQIHEASASFQLSENHLLKYILHYRLSVVFRGKNEERDLTLTTAISDVGTTKVEVPQAAIEKFAP